MSESPTELEVGFSTCPNDTFVFHALVTGLVPTPGIRWRPVLEDVETLNRRAFETRLPVTKISFHALGHLRDRYALLRSGAALGRGCGPLVVARDAGVGSRLERARVAIPGRWTSAALLLRLFAPRLPAASLVEMPFHRILGAVARGEVDAGLIIHESRFTYGAHGLVALEDLGAFWERTSGLPIPLGAIIAERRLGAERIAAIEAALRDSVRHARRQPQASAAYVREHAQELAPEVIAAHIGLYVNDFTEDLGDEGLRAIAALFREAEARGVLPRQDAPLTLPP
jgi:1,4-dihydroxy-6-naphthoate synthase